MSGELLAKELNGKGNVVLYSIPGQENLDERAEGFKRVVARNPGIKILQVVDMAGNPTKAFDGTRALIATGKTAPDAFVCLEALSCNEVADVLDRANIRGKTIIAMDTQEGTLNWMRKGMIRATIAQKPYTMAYFGTRVLDDFHHAKPARNASQRGGQPFPGAGLHGHGRHPGGQVEHGLVRGFTSGGTVKRQAAFGAPLAAL